MNVLVIAPHPDDESIGCGGRICIHTARGDRVVGVFITSGELGLKHLTRERAQAIREAEAASAARILRLAHVEFLRLPDWTVGAHVTEGARLLVPILERERPEIVYLPHATEMHPDHRAALPILREALACSRVRPARVSCYEVWTPVEDHDEVEDITPVMRQKLRAIRAHRSQLKEFNYLRAVRGLNEFRGELAGRCRYAEVFKAISLGDGA